MGAERSPQYDCTVLILVFATHVEGNPVAPRGVIKYADGFITPVDTDSRARGCALMRERLAPLGSVFACESFAAGHAFGAHLSIDSWLVEVSALPAR